jgi:hypothetical protein
MQKERSRMTDDRSAEDALTRRDFIVRATQSSLVVSGAALWTHEAAADAGAQEAALGRLRQTLVAPPDAARPMTRWWWFGGAVTPAEITRQLTFMRDAGLRGAEIQPVYPVALDDPAKGVRNLHYFSAEFRDVLRHTVREARRLGLQLDFTLGSGWPYGGPFVTSDLAARRLRALSQDFTGPRDFKWNIAPLLVGEDRMVAVLVAPVLEDGTPALDKALNVPPPGAEHRGWLNFVGMPAGRWRVMVFIDSPTGMLVKRPTVGMEGPVIDHHHSGAIAQFLRAAGDGVFDAIGSSDTPPFHSVFCDSLEVYGADWTERLVAEFQRRRGYDLTPYLPALFADAGPITPHIRYDYHLTLSDLIIDHFFVPLVAWSEKRGVQARIQAHGAMGDVMRGYGLAHIPEGENIFLGDRYQVNLKHRRLASSAAHLYGKALVSAETYTWLRTPLYTTTLEMMKAATDACLLDGINHIVNHGYSYSPPEAGAPGWAFYASTEVNHTQTWWRHYPQLARYVQRTCALLREGVSVNPVLVYLPMADVYAEYGAGSLHLDVEIAERFEPALFDALRQRGYDFDVVNDHALAERTDSRDSGAAGLRVEGGMLQGGAGAWRVMIVSNARLMPAASAEKIAAFVRAGGHLIVIGAVPVEAPGLRQREDDTARSRKAFEALWNGALPTTPTLSTAHSAALVADVPSALARLEAVLAPDFHIVRAGDGNEAALRDAREHVGFTHRRVDDADVYFVANVSATRRDLRVQFGAGHRAPQRWDAESDFVHSELAYEHAFEERGRRVTEVELRLDPFQSCFVVFRQAATAPAVRATDPRGEWTLTRDAGRVAVEGRVPAAGTYQFRMEAGPARSIQVGSMPTPLALDGPWTLMLGARGPLRLDRLRSWTDLPEGADFCGWGVYEIEVEVPRVERDVEWQVDLGLVHETAEISLNGRALGVAWKGARQLPCGDALVSGRNRLKVEVANLWTAALVKYGMTQGTPARDRPLRGVGADPELASTLGVRWGTYGEVAPKESRPSGLLGPVRLVPMKRVRATL